jgi:hypothetical protein
MADHSSKKYSRCHFLDYRDLLVEGFYDSGRERFASLSVFKKEKVAKRVDSSGNTCHREVLIVDSRLSSVVEEAQKFVRTYSGKRCPLIFLIFRVFCWLETLS